MGARFGAFSGDSEPPDEAALDLVSKLDDADLMGGIGRGDATCLGELLRRYWRTIVCYAAAMVDPDTAEDVAQETFLRVAASASRWRPLGAVNRYLLHIARNVALNERRRQRSRLSVLSLARPALRRAVPTPAEELEESELRAAIQRTMRAMPQRRREAFALIRFGGLSYREAAAVMGTSEQTVANQVSQALAEIRRSIEPLSEPQA